jgi:DNA-directed RNA polymerase specialized sigma24 family protein
MDHLNYLTAAAAVRVPSWRATLELYYERLCTWSSSLTRGDHGAARDIVHDLCVHLTLAQPDLSRIENLDAYLYRCLKHLYLSHLSRASRDALQDVHPIDFDSLHLVMRAQPHLETIQVQNDLRRICGYVAWRKSFAKSASFFILRYLHGYSLREIADLAIVPMSTIYPKLSQVRSEIRLYLSDPRKLQFFNRLSPPSPRLPWKATPSLELFSELQSGLLDASSADCLAEEELLVLYSSKPKREPLSCTQLAHIVSCSRCLNIIDRHMNRPTLLDREPMSGPDSSTLGNVDALLRSAAGDSSEIFHHYPEELSIATNGRIMTSHRVTSAYSTFSARIAKSEDVAFVEIFSGQGIRLALESITSLPPAGPHELIQMVALSDGRSLMLQLVFDGLGLAVEATYATEQYLESRLIVQEAESLVAPLQESPRWSLPMLKGLKSMLTVLRGSTGMAVATGLTIVCVLLIAVGVHRLPSRRMAASVAKDPLLEQLRASAPLPVGQTEHQVLQYDKVSAKGGRVQHGRVEIWRDGDRRRWSRRLIDDRHRVVAAEWIGVGGSKGAYTEPASVATDPAWKQVIPSEALTTIPEESLKIRRIDVGYELRIAATPNLPGIQSAVLVLDREYRPIREDLRVHQGDADYDLKFVETSYERLPSSSVLDQSLLPDLGSNARREIELSAEQRRVKLAELHIGVLYELQQVDRNRSNPVHITRTPDRLRVDGMVSSDADRDRLIARLQELPDQELLQIGLSSPSSYRLVPQGQESPRPIETSVVEISDDHIPLDTELRKYLASHGVAAGDLDSSVARLSHDAILRAQRALQDAAALRELCAEFSSRELLQVSPRSQQSWSAMLEQRATALNDDLGALYGQIAPLTGNPMIAIAAEPAIADPTSLVQQADTVLAEVQSLNRRVGEGFALTKSTSDPVHPEELLADIVKQIPRNRAQSISALAYHLHSSAEAKAALSPLIRKAR